MRLILRGRGGIVPRDSGRRFAAEYLEPRTLLAISFTHELLWLGVDTPGDVAVGDFNNDSVDDLAIVGKKPGVQILVGAGDGTFGQLPFAAVPGPGPRTLAVADFNRDGNADVAATTRYGDVQVLAGQGDGTLGPATTVNLTETNWYADTGELHVGDFNGDGRPDLVVPYPPTDSVAVLLNDRGSRTGFAPAVFVAVGGEAYDAAVGDFDGDGNQDLAACGELSNRVAVALGDGSGGFGPAIRWDAGTNDARSIAAGDVNNDGRLDLVVDVPGGWISVLKGTGGGAFLKDQHYLLESLYTGGSLVLADFDNDGDLDVAATYDSNSFNVFVVPNDGTGAFGADALPFVTTGHGAASLAVGEFGGSDKPDLVSVHAEDTPGAVQLNTTLSGLAFHSARWLHPVVTEGAAAVTKLAKVQVTLPSPPRATASLRYATADGTASVRAGDYTPTSGVLTFRPGETVREVLVPVVGDDAVEGDEQFYVDFSDPVNLSLPRQRAVVTIGNDDGAGRLSFEQPAFTVNEGGAATATVGVRRTGGTQGVVTVEYLTSDRTAVAGADYTAVNARLVFQPGQTRATFTVPIADDGSREPMETLGLTLRNPGGGAALGGPDTSELQILDDEPHVVGRHVFYNNSAFDGFDPRPSADDDRAIAPDKRLVPRGEPGGSFANTTSFAKGINGVMVDLLPLSPLGTLGPPDIGADINDGRGGAWTPAPPPSITVRRGAGVGGSDRVTLVWPDGQLRNVTLRVVIHPGDATGLSRPEYLYLSNLVGETGDAASPGRVRAIDLARVRRNLSAAAALSSAYDFDRDGKVGATDLLLARRALAGGLSGLAS